MNIPTESDVLQMKNILSPILEDKIRLEKLCRDLGFVQEKSKKIYTESLIWYNEYTKWDISARKYYRETINAIIAWRKKENDSNPVQIQKESVSNAVRLKLLHYKK
jgi:hypothetical protein